jgi:hypothetical protein
MLPSFVELLFLTITLAPSIGCSSTANAAV